MSILIINPQRSPEPSMVLPGDSLLVGDVGPEILHPKALGELCLWIAAGLTVVTGWDYLMAGLGAVRREER